MTTKPENDAEVWKGPHGIELRRHGRLTSVEVSRTPEEHRKMQEQLCQYAKTLPSEIDKIAASLKEELRRFNSFDILANLFFANLWFDPDTYKEYSHEGKSAFVEYAALLLLQDEFVEAGIPFVDGPTIGRLQGKLTDIFRHNLWLAMGKRAEIGSEPSALSEMARHVESYELTVRNPAYEQHFNEVILGLFGRFDTEIFGLLGFTISDSLKLERAIRMIMMERIADRCRLSDKNAKEFLREARHYRKHHVVRGNIDLPEDIIKRLGNTSERKAKRLLKGLSTQWTFLNLGQSVSFTPSELANRAEVGRQQTQAFLDRFSLEFGGLDQGTSIPTPTHPLKRKPIVTHGGRYLASVPLLVPWAIQMELEDSLRATKVWNRYSKHRHEVLLATSIRRMERVMPEAKFHKNLIYSYEKSGSRIHGELDGLGVYDRVLFLVEAKAGRITERARRGHHDRIEKHLKELVGVAHRQANRAREFVG